MARILPKREPEINAAKSAADSKTLQQILAVRMSIWPMVLAFPFQVGIILLVLRKQSGARPAQVGLTVHRFGLNTLLGALAWGVLTPTVLALHALVNFCYHSLTRVDPEGHPFQRLGQQHLMPLEWTLLALAAVVAAPVLEEFFFRGLLQPWFMERRWGTLASVAAALVVALARRAAGLEAAWKNGTFGLHELEPAAFVVLMTPVCLFADRVVGRWLTRPGAANAICGTSLIFAASHSIAWPQPIPLFVLSLGLGFLAYRTRSLVAPIVLHALFNGIATVMLILSSQAPLDVKPPKGNEATSAAWLSPSPAICTAAPAASLPRRT